MIFQVDKSCEPYSSNLASSSKDYEWVYVLRRVFIGVSSIALLISMAMIIRRRQYKFNTIKIFFWAQFFYLISLLSVAPHDASFNLNQTQYPDNRTEYLNCLAQSTLSSLKCGLQGFINLGCYAVRLPQFQTSYWLAVCLTSYIRYVLKDRQKQFWRQKRKMIVLVVVLIFTWYAVPFILVFKENVLFSFGPTGYRWSGSTDLLLYSGIVSRDESMGGKYLVDFWMLFPSFLMFIYHLYTIWRNKRYYRRLRQLDDSISTIKEYLIETGQLSFWLFAVQILNFIKLVLVSLGGQGDDEGFKQFIFILNSAFDLIALVFLVVYHIKYYKKGMEIRSQECQIQSFEGHPNISTVLTYS